MEKKEPTLSTKEFSNITGLPISVITKMLRAGQLIGEKNSGKWVIFKDQRQPISSLNPPHCPGTDKNALPITLVSTSESLNKNYSISEFSQITYLTEFGVREWLKIGKIKGHMDEKGCWRVDAENLKLPILQHLLRN